MATRKVKTETELLNPNLSTEQLVVKQAQNEFDVAANHWMNFRDGAAECLRFVNSEHFNATYIASRQANGLPCLTENHIPAILDVATSQIVSNMPAVQLDPMDGQTSADMADKLADVIRGIEQESNAEAHRAKAAWYSVGTGLGYTRLRNEYVSNDPKDPNCFKQRLVLDEIADPFTVYLDPSHKEVDGSDSEYAFIVVDMTHDEYLRRFGSARGKVAQTITDARANGWTRSDIKAGNYWFTKETVRVAEYYVKRYTTEKVFQVLDRSTGGLKTTSERPANPDDILTERDVQRPTVCHYILNEKEILDENTWPGPWIPITAYKGREYWINGNRVLKGLVQDLRDPQLRIDYFQNWQATMVMLASTGQYMGTATNFAENQHEWRDINLSNQAYITYVPDPANGGTPPSRDLAEPAISAAQVLVGQAVEGLQRVSGVTPHVPQENSPVESGIAKLTRIENSQTTNQFYRDNIRHSIAHEGRLILAALPTFYGENGREVTATKLNGETYTVTLNDDTDRFLEDMRLKVVVESGATYHTRRQAAAADGFTLMGVLGPEKSGLFADLVVDNTDWPGRRDIAARLRAAVPPQILQATEAVDEKEAPALVAQLKSQVAALQQANAKLTAESLPDKEKIQKLEMETAFAKHDTSFDLEKAKLDHSLEMRKLDLEEQRTILEAEIKRKELEQSQELIDIKKRELGMKGTIAAADIASDVMEHHHKVQENLISTSEPNDAKTGFEGDDNDLPAL